MKLPSVQELKENKHLGVSVSRAHLEDIYRLSEIGSTKSIRDRESPVIQMASSIFKSKVDRLPDIIRNNPGPGEYEIKVKVSEK